MQLAGHLRGQALQEWSLIDPGDRRTWEDAIQALRIRLDPGTKAMAAQDFRHLSQADTESVANYIRRLERTFRVAYGRDNMSKETRETLLHSQLQEGLQHELMKAPAVSRAKTYKQLCMAAKNEEKRLEELRRRQLHHKSSSSERQSYTARKQQNWKQVPYTGGKQKQISRQCYTCCETGHLAKDCRTSILPNLSGVDRVATTVEEQATIQGTVKGPI